MGEYTQIERLCEVIRHFEILWQDEMSKVNYLTRENERLRENLELLDKEFRKLKDEIGDCEDYEPSDLEVGFDPYLGCYTDDC